jgi:hypothetical protein
MPPTAYPQQTASAFWGSAGPLQREVRGAPSAATPRVFYVDPRGSDANSGSSAAPFRSLQRAADVVQAGDTVIARSGIYSGSGRIVSLDRSGTADHWITFRSERKWGAVIDGRDSGTEGWYFGPGVSFVRVEGFEIRNLREHAFDTYGGGVHDLVIAHNHVHHIGRYCTDTSNGRTGASLGAGSIRVTLDGNVWHDIGRYAPGEQGCSPKSRNYQNHDHGIYVADADDIIISNNLFYNFRRGWAVHRYFSGGNQSSGLVIANNTFVGANPYRPGQVILATPTANLRIENNIFHGPQTAALYFEDVSFSHGLVRHNLVSEGSMMVGRPRGVTFSKNWEWTDPGFAYGSHFQLGPGSPAIDVGLPLREVTQDAQGAARPRGKGYDLGAFERQ